VTKWILAYMTFGLLLFLAVGGFRKYGWGHLLLSVVVGPFLFAVGFVLAVRQLRSGSGQDEDG